MTTLTRTSERSSTREPCDTGLDVVTGAFGYSGRAIAAALVQEGRSIRTLTGHPDRAPSDSNIEVRPLDFDNPIELARSLEGVTTLYNTYWVRFAKGRRDHATAVANAQTLFDAAERAGVQRIVHISITNPSIESPYLYFHSKALVERALAPTGISYAVVRPAILFGNDGVLINNIAWLLRRMPVFAVGGDGSYRIRAIHVDDLAQLCVRLGRERTDTIVNAVGPDRPTFIELAEAIRSAVGSHAPFIRVPGSMIPLLTKLLGIIVHDVVITPDEYYAMADGLADVDGPATGQTSILEWIQANGDSLGRTYANDIARHFR
jgi:NADH dehydrogenase